MTRFHKASIVRWVVPLLACGALLPASAVAAGMVFHLDPADLEVLQQDSDSDEDSFAFRDENVQVESGKFQEYRDLRSGFRLRELHIWGDDPDSDRYFDFLGYNVGRQDSRLGLEYGTWGGWGIDVDYNKIPHRFGNNALFLWNITGPGHFEIADPTQLAVQNAIAAQFAANPAGVTYPFLRGLLTPYLQAANSLDVGLQRDRTDVTFELGKMAALGWVLQIQHENRNGFRPYGGSFGFGNAPEIVEPIDYDTSSAEVRGEWNTKTAGAQFGVRYSRFTNNISTLYWDNPVRGTNSTDPNAYSAPGSSSIGGAATGFADLAPDNTAGLAFFNGRAKLGASWWVKGRASYQVLEQDERLQPYTLNSAIVGHDAHGAAFDPTNRANLPAQSFDGKVKVANLAADAGTDLGDRFDLAFRYRYYDYDNQSGVIDFPGYVRFHAVWEDIERHNAPYSYTRETATAELGWEVNRSSNLLLAVERRSWKRELQETANTDEDAVRLSFDTRAITNLALRATYELGDRSFDEYDNERGGGATFPEPESTNLPGMRKFNQAERTYDLWLLQGDYTISDTMTLSGNWQGRQDDYDKSAFGLQSADTMAYGLELGWAFAAGRNLYVFANRDDIEYFLQSRQSGATPSTDPLANWSGDFSDETTTFGVGFDCDPCGKWTVGVAGRYSQTAGFLDFFSPPGGTPDVAFDIPNYDDVTLWAFDGRVDYRLTEHFSMGVSLLYEDYEINSFLTRGLIPFLPAAPLLDLVNGGYQGNVFGAHLKIEM
jgi:MtrB/PioB family decaheme-associated outer membrane protein